MWFVARIILYNCLCE